MRDRPDPRPNPRESILLNDERKELDGLSFFEAEWERLKQRALISQELYTTVAAETAERRRSIEVRGRARAEYEAAGRLSQTRPRDALHHVESARAIDPSWRDVWDLELDLRRRLEDDDGALALCSEGASRFPGFTTPDEYQAQRAHAAKLNAELAHAHDALNHGDDRQVIEICTPIVAEDVDHLDATVLLAFANQRLGRLPQALELYRRLTTLQPDAPTWREWVANVEQRLNDAEVPVAKPVAQIFEELPPEQRNVGFVPAAPPSAPRLSIQAIANEFLLEHWKNLLLCLGVLLIVVASNVGAYQLLGPRLWSPIGKCLLALSYTSMFAGLGTGLARWGAERAGRFLLLTTLIVIPANFMLMGQMKLLTEPSFAHWLVLGIDSAALFVLIRVVAAVLKLPRGAGFLSLMVFSISAFNAAASPDSPWPRAVQFAVFVIPAFLLFGSEVWLTTRFQEAEFEERRETTYGVLFLLTFAFLSGLMRSGVFMLAVAPTLYAVPIMMLAVACVHAAGRLHRFDPEPKHAAWIKFGGLTLSGFAFALALARPEGAVYSGSTLFTALLGFALYTALLIKERHPSYLYFGFGALFLAYFGAFYFTKDLMAAVEQSIGHLLGYQRKLPFAFKSINGWVFSPVLALLSLGIRRHWSDPRLARHCHYIGVPLAVGACILSAFEPKAALICLTGYAVLFTLAVPVFAVPWVIYLVVAATSGAAYFASTFCPGVTLAEQGFVMATLGLTSWAVGFGVQARGINRSYRAPLQHTALALATIASMMCGFGDLGMGHVSLASGGALLIACVTYVLVDRDLSLRCLAFAASAAGNIGLVMLAIHLGGRFLGPLSVVRVAVATSAVGLLSVILTRQRRVVTAGSYPVALELATFLQVTWTLSLCGVDAWRVAERLAPGDFAAEAVALGLAAASLGLLTRVYPFIGVAHLTVACGLGVWLCVLRVAIGGGLARPASYSAVASTYAFFLLVLEEIALWYGRRGRTSETYLHVSDLFARALPEFEVGIVFGAVAVGVSGLTNGPALILTLAFGAAALVWSTRLRPNTLLVDLSIVLSVLAVWCGTAWSVGGPVEGIVLAWLGLTTAATAALLWALGWSASHRERFSLYAWPTTRAALILPFIATILALIGNIETWKAYPISVSAFGVNTVVLTLLSMTRKRQVTTYRAVISLTLGIYALILSLGSGSPDTTYLLGLIAVGIALGLQAVAFALRSRANEANALERLFAWPLIVSSAILAILACAPAYNSPWTLLPIASAFLILVKGWPSKHWLYPTIGVLVLALYGRFLSEWPESSFVTVAVVLAYQFWLLAVLTRRAEPALIRRLMLPETGYDYPLFHSAGAACLGSILLRMGEVSGGIHPWYDSAGLSISVAVFAVLMIKAYPSPTWLHLALSLATAAAMMAAAPMIDSPLYWLLFGMALATSCAALTRLAGPRLTTLCHWCGVPEMGYLATLLFWSRMSYVVSLVFTSMMICNATILTHLKGTIVPNEVEFWPWADVMIALALGGVWQFLSFVKRPSSSISSSTNRDFLILLSIWWLAAPGSPLLTQLGMNPAVYLPLVTAAAAVFRTGCGLSTSCQSAWPTGQWSIDLSGRPDARLEVYSASVGLILSIFAGFLTIGTLNMTTAETLTIATIAPALAASRRQWVVGGYASNLFAITALTVAGTVIASWMGVATLGDRLVAASAGSLAAGAGLWLVAGWQRRRDGIPLPSEIEAQTFPASTVPVAWEHGALLAGVVAVAAIIASLGQNEPNAYGQATAIVVLFSVALLVGGLVLRWGVEWLVYVAQSCLLGGFLYYRRINPMPVNTDLAVLTLFGYIDLGLAEVLHRSRLARFSRPTRNFALALPLLPIMLALSSGEFETQRLFVFFAVATFYGAAGASIGWKPLGYASAVLYNAFLWLLWGHIGWTVADHSQFYLIPVGLSAILFAEVNRRELGLEAVNAIRGVGLAVIYLSLAAPVWQFASLGAWVALLLISLLGIFVGIGLRVQIFLWLGLASFLLDVLYQLGRMGLEHTLAKWAIMLGLGLLLVLFVALNEKKRIVAQLRASFEEIRQWE